MAEAASTRNWAGQLTWLAVSTLIVFFQLLPLDTTPMRWSGPDWLLVVALVCVNRRPEFAPVWLIAIVFFLADLLYMRPPGLMAGLVVILTEMFRNRASSMRQLPFPLEWATVGLGVMVIMFAERIALAMSLTPQAAFSLSMIEAVATALAYPIVAFLGYLIFGISRPAPGEVNALGHRF